MPLGARYKEERQYKNKLVYFKTFNFVKSFFYDSMTTILSKHIFYHIVALKLLIILEKVHYTAH